MIKRLNVEPGPYPNSPKTGQGEAERMDARKEVKAAKDRLEEEMELARRPS